MSGRFGREHRVVAEHQRVPVQRENHSKRLRRTAIRIVRSIEARLTLEAAHVNAHAVQDAPLPCRQAADPSTVATPQTTGPQPSASGIPGCTRRYPFTQCCTLSRTFDPRNASSGATERQTPRSPVSIRACHTGRTKSPFDAANTTTSLSVTVSRAAEPAALSSAVNSDTHRYSAENHPRASPAPRG